MHLSIEGDEATAKTTFAYTAPTPIVGFSFDLGSERAIYGTKFDDYFKGLDIQINNWKSKASKLGKDITIWEMPIPVQLDPAHMIGMSELWQWFMQKMVEACGNDDVRTIVVDTMTLARSLASDAHLQSLQTKNTDRKQLLQIEWKDPNGKIQAIWDYTRALGKNMIGVHHLKDDYKEFVNSKGEKESVNVGTKSLEGLKTTHRIVDIAIRNEKATGVIKTKIMKCGYNLSQEGLSLDNCDWNCLVGSISMSLGDRINFERRS